VLEAKLHERADTPAFQSLDKNTEHPLNIFRMDIFEGVGPDQFLYPVSQ
jgi:hypothetical protein